MDQSSENNRNSRRSGGSADRRRSIRDISLSDEIKGKRRPARATGLGGGNKKSYYKRGSRSARYGVTALAIILVVFGGIFSMSAFAKATMTIVPRSENITVNEEVTISEASVGGTALSYEVFTLEEVGSKRVEGGEEKVVERNAQGKITIYNTDSRDQALVVRTRFESEEGNIYRITDQVLVPAARGDRPGSFVATVVSDEAGEGQNLTSGRFTIPGLEGTELYTKMYAEVNSPIEGGFVGTEMAVSDAEERSAREDIQSRLTTSLQEKAVSSLPAEYMLVPNSTFLEFEELPNESSGGAVSVRTKGVIYGVMIKKDLLASYLATENIDGYQNLPLEISNSDNLMIQLDVRQPTLSDIQNEITLILEGDATLRWKINEDDIRKSISGAAKGEAVGIAGSNPAVKEAKLKLVPGFLRSIPTNPDKIDIVIVDGS